ncbi:two-component system response regulator YesN [Aequitasia blattaphilus]|uniref:Stage 0 sporulation protein A homolog n=1 Tax=Aequitasia blattaphilus TaxID=2949332 RepID=A0ABT1E8I0_9FIRM|nr:response regulator [Aequitasia blattaphilus]MCP1102128.1 response regulator [Aequitasia blattaphilus]MCR8614768.1 response regulator [Aequitasia blattaphilus]
MMKALIVDDEKIIRVGIHAVVPWDELGIGEVFMAASGIEALEILEREKPEIMITDIQMAEMNGLTLIEKIREIRKDIRIIVLTGYDDFDYARQCLRMQVQEFLLKPVDEDVLIQTIQDQISAMNERQYMRRIAGTKDQVDLENKMHRLISKADAKEAAKEMYQEYHFASNLKMRGVILIPTTYANRVEALSVLSIKNILIGFLDANQQGITFEDPKGRIAAVLFEGEKSDELENTVHSFTKLIQEECQVRLRVVMGETVEGFEHFYLSYNDAMYLLEKEQDNYKMFIKHPEGKGQLDMFREVYRELINGINENIGNTDTILRIYDAFCKATNSYNISDQYVRKCCFEIASMVYFNYIVESGDNGDSKLNSLLVTLLNAGREENYEITKAFLENLLRVEGDEAGELITKVKRYINEHLTEDISVAGIAAEFFVSPSYFSRLFKRITNEGCNEYIVRKRIESARYLIATTNMKIGKIAQEVGYRDTNYFSLAFKKHMGQTPGQYRESIRTKGDKA